MLNATRLNEVFHDCFYSDEEVSGKSDEELMKMAVVVEALTMRLGFKQSKLDEHRAEVAAMLDELPEAFHEKTGGGMSFLAACEDKHGRQWGEHRNMEQLFALGMAMDLVKYCLPREMWNMLPGGVPYLVVMENKNGETLRPEVREGDGHRQGA